MRRGTHDARHVLSPVPGRPLRVRLSGARRPWSAAPAGRGRPRTREEPMPRSRFTLLPLDVMSEPEAASAGPPERLRPRRPKTPVRAAVSIPAAWRHPPPLGPPAARHRRLPGATPRRRPCPAPIRPSHRRHPSCARVSLRRDSCRHRRPRPSSPGASRASARGARLRGSHRLDSDVAERKLVPVAGHHLACQRRSHR